MRIDWDAFMDSLDNGPQFVPLDGRRPASLSGQIRVNGRYRRTEVSVRRITKDGVDGFTVSKVRSY